MGKILQKTVSIRELVVFQKDKMLPLYKSQYTWNDNESVTLVKDVFQALDKGSYMLGSFVYSSGNLVDGLSRLVSIALVLKALEKPYPDLVRFWNVDEIERLRKNYERIRKALSFVDKELFFSFFMDKCYVLLIECEDILDCFSFFEKGDQRGKALEPTDILKSYHLCSMRDECEMDKLSVVSRWESIPKSDLLSLFDIWYMIIRWSKGNDAAYFGIDSINSFKGIEEDLEYPFAKKVDTNAFSLDTFIVNGSNFFFRCFYYVEKKRELEGIIKKVFPSLMDNLNLDDISEKLCFQLFMAFSLLMFERFGQEPLEKALPILFKFSFVLLLENSSVSLERVNKYVISETSLFKKVQYALDPYEIYSYDLGKELSSIRNLVCKKGAGMPIDFEVDYNRWLTGERK